MGKKKAIGNVLKKGQKKKVSLKNVLCQPFPKYWPQVNQDAVAEFTSILQTIRNKNPEVFKKTKGADADKKPLLFGLQSAVRHINQGKTRTLILSTGIRPQFIAHNIVAQAVHKIPECDIICVPNLSSIMKEFLGFETLAIATLAENDNIKEYTKWIHEKSVQFTKPVTSKLTIKDLQPVTAIKQKKKKPKIEVDLSTIYLKKLPDDDCLELTPNSSHNDNSNTNPVDLKLKTEWTDFISLSDAPAKSIENKIQNSLNEENKISKTDETHKNNEKVKININKRTATSSGAVTAPVSKKQKKESKPPVLASAANKTKQENVMQFKIVDTSHLKKHKKNKDKNKKPNVGFIKKQTKAKKPTKSKIDYIAMTVNKIKANPNKHLKKCR